MQAWNYMGEKSVSLLILGTHDEVLDSLITALHGEGFWVVSNRDIGNGTTVLYSTLPPIISSRMKVEFSCRDLPGFFATIRAEGLNEYRVVLSRCGRRGKVQALRNHLQGIVSRLETMSAR
jgi:hypothetical protein